MLVDAVSSFAGMDIHPEDCLADVFVTGPGKCLGGPPGLTLMAVNQRAWTHMEKNPKAPRASILSLLDWRDAWRRDKPFPFTPAVSEVNGLDGAIDQYLDEGPERVWARHASLPPPAAPASRLWGCSSGRRGRDRRADLHRREVPDGVNDKQWLAAARELYGVVFSTGRNETAGKLIRIGHMGPVAEPIYATVALTALGGALRHLGKQGRSGGGPRGGPVRHRKH